MLDLFKKREKGNSVTSLDYRVDEILEQYQLDIHHEEKKLILLMIQDVILKNKKKLDLLLEVACQEGVSLFQSFSLLDFMDEEMIRVLAREEVCCEKDLIQQCYAKLYVTVFVHLLFADREDKDKNEMITQCFSSVKNQYAVSDTKKRNR